MNQDERIIALLNDKIRLLEENKALRQRIVKLLGDKCFGLLDGCGFLGAQAERERDRISAMVDEALSL